MEHNGRHWASLRDRVGEPMIEQARQMAPDQVAERGGEEMNRQFLRHSCKNACKQAKQSIGSGDQKNGSSKEFVAMELELLQVEVSRGKLACV